MRDGVPHVFFRQSAPLPGAHVKAKQIWDIDRVDVRKGLFDGGEFTLQLVDVAGNEFN